MLAVIPGSVGAAVYGNAAPTDLDLGVRVVRFFDSATSASWITAASSAP
jgi:UDP-N-acetylenolpyruvoylglucosamine reductase